MAKRRNSVRRKTAARRRPARRNPAKRQDPGASLQAQVREAVARFTGFRGDAPAEIRRIAVRPPDRVQLTLGTCIGIMYETVRDGRREKYLHKFTQKARPHLTCSQDGRQLYLIGGSYSVTDRGIEDAK